MRRLTPALAVLLFAARAASAGSMLFTTAATDGRIDGFCLGPNGRFVQETPSVQFGLAKPYPHRIVFVPAPGAAHDDAGTLYVTENDRVEAFRIGPDGNVARHCGASGTERCRGRTEVRGAMRTRGMVVDGERRVLYLVQRGFDRVVAYPLDADGLPPAVTRDDAGRDVESFTSCVQGRIGSGYGDLVVQDGRAYVGAIVGRVDVFGVLPDGRFCKGEPCVATTAAECTLGGNDPDFAITPPLLQKRRLSLPTAIAVANGMLYVQVRGTARLVGFRLDELEAPPEEITSRTPAPPERVTTTTGLPPYNRLLLFESTFLGTLFGRGRVDVISLQEPGTRRECTLETCPSGTRCCLPRRPTRSSESDLRMSPAGLTVARMEGGPVLYVAGGDLDRVRAYRLTETGSLAGGVHFSESAEQADSFPNSVQVAELAGACR